MNSIDNNSLQVVPPETQQLNDSMPLVPKIKSAVDSKKGSIAQSYIAFILSAIVFLLFGPGLLLMVQIMSWAAFIYFSYVYYAVSCIVVPIILILTGFGIIRAYKKASSTQFRTAVILALGTVAGMPAALFFPSILLINMPLFLYAIILSAAAILPIILIVIINLIDKKAHSSQYFAEPAKSSKTSLVVAILVAFITFAEVAIPIKIIVEVEQETIKIEAMKEALNKKNKETHINSEKDVFYDVCNGTYSLVYKKANSTGGFYQCDDGFSEVYYIDDSGDKYTNDGKVVSVTYLGATGGLSDIFPDAFHIYRKYSWTVESVDLVLLVEADSEQEVIEKYAQPILTYLESMSGSKNRIAIFYVSDLSDVNETKDYIALADTFSLPNRSTTGSKDSLYYRYTPDSTKTLTELNKTSAFYASKIYDEIKTKRHISFEISNEDATTLEEITTILQNSFK